MTQTPALPIACSLTPEAARKAALLPGLFRRAVSTESLPNGVCLQFGASTEAIQAIVATIEAERQCCRFLRFDLTVEPDGGPIRLTLTGPDGTAEFLTALVQE